MARRSRRRRAPSASTANPRSYSRLRARAAHDRSETPAPSSQQAPSEQSSVQTSGLRGSDQINWQAEYNPIFSDLKQLLLISGVLFALMIMLGFVL